MKKLVLVFFLGCMLISCGSKKEAARKKAIKRVRTERVIVNSTPQNNSVIENDNTKTTENSNITINSTEDYLSFFSAIAQDEMRLYGIPASITLAQGILESNSGKGRLSVEANNHFGIKCHDWTGAKIYHDDDASQECFRKYNDAKYSYRDHSLFLTMRKRYSKLFLLDKDDYKGWAKELKLAGYATDRAYPQKLISLIERYQLYRFDDEVLGNKKRSVNKEPIRQVVHIVVKGDTLYSISKKYNMTVKELQESNSISGTDIKIGQQLFVGPSAIKN